MHPRRIRLPQGTSYRSPWHMCHTGRTVARERTKPNPRAGIAAHPLVMKILVLAAVLVAGCGGAAGGDGATGGSGGSGGGGGQSPLVGNWITSVSSSCDAYLDVTASEFAFGTLCIAADSSIDLQEETGTYSLVGASLTMTGEKSTCPNTPRTYLETVTFPAGGLELSDSSGIIAFQPNTASGGSGVATYGCFMNGTFTAAPLAPF